MSLPLGRFLKDLRGTSAMEFAFVVPVMLVLIAGIVEFGRWFQAYDGVNRLATRYAAVYSDCNDNPTNASPSPQACNAELAQYWPSIAIKNIAPQLTNGTVTVRMFQVQYSSTGAASTVYSYPSSATMSTAESQAGTTIIYSAGQQETGVVVTVQYSYVPLFFSTLFKQLAPNWSPSQVLTYTVAQRKT